MFEFVIAVLMVLSCVAAGTAALVWGGLWSHLNQFERQATAFAIGFGILGWVVFWIGIAGQLTPFSVAGSLCAMMLGGLWIKKSTPTEQYKEKFGPWANRFLMPALSILIVAVFALDVLEALAPPVEADSSAYQFHLPRVFADSETVTFVPRVFSGAVPLLVNMTYSAALAIGQITQLDAERILTFWTLLSGWGGAVLLFGLARRWLPTPMALAFALIYQTMPTFIYGAGTGQVESRLGLFVLAAVVLLIQAHRIHNDIKTTRGLLWAPIVLLGLVVGFYVGSKYTGLFFALAVGIGALMLGRGWFSRGLVYSGCVMVAGFQWYLWNYLHTGDPVFPFLYDFLRLPDGIYWTEEHSEYLGESLRARGRIISGFWDALIYPVMATLAPPSGIDSGRVGLGPAMILFAPMAIWGAVRKRKILMASPLMPVSVMVVVYYFLWIKFGAIPKVRHFSPLVGSVLLLLGVAAIQVRGASGSLVAALAFTIVLQTGGQILFAKTYVERFVYGEDRDIFYSRVLGEEYQPVMWINEHRLEIRHLVTTERHLVYQFKVPTTLIHPLTYAVIDTRDGLVNSARFFKELHQAGVTHVFDNSRVEPTVGTYGAALMELERRGCLVALKRFAVTRYQSRTLRTGGRHKIALTLWRVSDGPCETD